MDLCDDDDDEDDDARGPSQGLHGEKANSQIIAENEHLKRVEMIKRNRASDIQTSTSTSTSISSADLFETDNRPAKRNLAMVLTLCILSALGNSHTGHSLGFLTISFTPI